MNLFRRRKHFDGRGNLLAALLAVALQTRNGLAQNQSAATNHFGLESQPAVRLETAYGRRVHAHDPSTIVKCGDEFWVFYTGRGVPCYHSKDLKTWEPGPRVFSKAPAWTAQAVPSHTSNYFWAPDIIHLGDRFLLYYAVSIFGKNVSAIGLATNPTLDPKDPEFHWTDFGPVIQSAETNDFNAIDPAVCRDADGKLWLAFGSFWSGIKLIGLDPQTGRRIAPDSPVYSLAHNDSIEAAYIYPHANFYYLFVNWGLCCRGTNSTYEIRVGRAQKITGPYLDESGTDMLTDGGSPFLKTSGAFIGPGHAGIISDNGADWFSCHFYDGTRGGRSTLAVLPLRWDANGWPEISVGAAN
jgi:arabinan endo-1,5-alpha-L-arabinosidase